jgi:hypothetical protein
VEKHSYISLVQRQEGVLQNNNTIEQRTMSSTENKLKIEEHPRTNNIAKEGKEMGVVKCRKIKCHACTSFVYECCVDLTSINCKKCLGSRVNCNRCICFPINDKKKKKK